VDAMDYMMQTVQEYESFGGVQVVYWWFIAIATGNSRWGIRIRNYTKEIFFSFACRTAKSAIIHWVIYIYRQTDTEFISVLNNLRNNKLPQPMFKHWTSTLNLILI
jgi:hypothetical protein